MTGTTGRVSNRRACGPDFGFEEAIMRFPAFLVFLGFLASGITAGAAAREVPSAAAPPAGHPAATPTPPTPLPVEAAILKVANDLFGQIVEAGESIEIVIDPLIDGVTGARTEATQHIGRRIAEIAAERHPRVTVLPFTRDNIARARFVFIGTFNPINNAGQPEGARDAFWICFALVDPKDRKSVV